MATDFDDLLEAPPVDVADGVDALGFEDLLEPAEAAPEAVADTGQSRLASAGNEALKGLAKVGTSTLEGLGQASSSIIRNLTPFGWAAKAGFEPAQKVVDFYTAPGEKAVDLARLGDATLDESLPTNPAYEKEWLASKIPGVVGQAVGQLGSALIPAKWLALGSKAVQAVGLSQAGLMGLSHGYKEAERIGITDPVKRDIFATLMGGVEAGSESLGGIGGKSMSKALTGEIRDLLDGTALKTFTKAAAIEGLEEDAAQIPQNLASYAFAENDAPLQTVNPLKGEYWSNLAEAFGLGAVGGGVFGGYQATINRKTASNAMAMRASVANQEEELLAKQAAGEALSPEEQADLTEMKGYDSRLSAWLESQGLDQASQQAGLVTARAISSATRAGMPATADALRVRANLSGRASADMKTAVLETQLDAMDAANATKAQTATPSAPQVAPVAPVVAAQGVAPTVTNPSIGLTPAEILSRVDPQVAQSMGLDRTLAMPVAQTGNIPGVLAARINESPGMGMAARYEMVFNSRPEADAFMSDLAARGLPHGVNDVGPLSVVNVRGLNGLAEIDALYGTSAAPAAPTTQNDSQPKKLEDVEVQGVDDIVSNGGGTLKVTHQGQAVDFTDFAVTVEGNEAEVYKVKVKDRGDTSKGIGTLAYIKLGQELAKRGITLRSSNAQYADGRKVWERLVKMGHAEKAGTGYKFVNQPTTTESGQATADPVAQAREALNRALTPELRAALSAAGVTIEENGEMGESLGRARVTKDNKVLLVLNPNAVANRIKGLTDEQANAEISDLIEHELIHLAWMVDVRDRASNAAQTEGRELRDGELGAQINKEAADVWTSLEGHEDLRSLIPDGYGKTANDAHSAAELLRMLVQMERNGTVSEIAGRSRSVADKIKALVQRISDTLAKWLGAKGNWSPELKAAHEATLRVLAQLEGSPTKTTPRPPNAPLQPTPVLPPTQVSPQTSVAPPDAAPTVSVLPAAPADGAQLRNPVQNQVGQEFARRAQEARDRGDKDAMNRFLNAGEALVQSLEKHGNAFTGVQFRKGLGGAMVLETDGSLVIDPDFTSAALERGLYTPESLDVTVNEEVTHQVVNLATAAILTKELGRSPTTREVYARHAQDWRNLPKKVQQESERLYQLAAIHRARVEAGKESLTEEEIQAVISGIQATDVERGAEFKRQVIQGRIWGVLTEEANKNSKFNKWLSDFLNELLVAIRDITKRITDPSALKMLDDLEHEVRAELAKLGVEPAVKSTTTQSDVDQTSSGQAADVPAPASATFGDSGQQGSSGGIRETPPSSEGRASGVESLVQSRKIDEIVGLLDRSAAVPNMTAKALAQEVTSLAGNRLPELREALGMTGSAQDIANQLLAETKKGMAQKRVEESAPVAEKPVRVEGDEIGERPLTKEEKLERRVGETEEAPEGMRAEDLEGRLSAAEPVSSQQDAEYLEAIEMGDTRTIDKSSVRSENDSYEGQEIERLHAASKHGGRETLGSQKAPDSSAPVFLKPAPILGRGVKQGGAASQEISGADSRHVGGSGVEVSPAIHGKRADRRGEGANADGADPLPAVSTPEQDAEWLARNPKTAAKLQSMVDGAARSARYTVGPLWHRTWSNFSEFILGGKDAKSHSWLSNEGKQRTRVGSSGRAIFLSFDKEKTPAFHNQKKTGENFIKGYAKVRNPLVIDDDTREFAVDVFADGFKDFPLIVTEEARKALQDAGHDAVYMYYNGRTTADGNPDEVILLEPSQIKSADPITRDKNGNVIPLSQRFNPDSPSILYASPPVEPAVNNKDRLKQLADWFRRTSSQTQEEGTEPANATKEERERKATGEKVSEYRPPMTKAEIDQNFREMLARSAQESLLPFNKRFGEKVLAYLEDKGDLEGIPRTDMMQVWLGIQIQNNTNGIATRLGIDPRSAESPTQAALSRAGTTLGLAVETLYKPIQRLRKEAQEVSEKKMKKEGIENDQKFAEDINAPIQQTRQDQLEDVQKVMSTWFEDALPSFGEKSKKGLERLRAIMTRISELRQRKAALGALSASQPVGSPEPQTIEDIDAELAALVGEADNIISEIFGTKRRVRKAKPKAEQAEKEIKAAVEAAEEAIASATFTEWVSGKEQDGVPKFVDLMSENINAAGFDRDAFMESLLQKFENVDKDLIEDVANRVGDALDAKTEEATEAEAPDYDSRAKRVVALAVADDSQPEPKDGAPNPFTVATKKRLREEITAEQYLEELAKLNVEPQSAFAMNRKVERDIAELNELKLKRKSKQELERSKKEAEREIDRLVQGLLGSKTPAEKSEYRKSVDAYRAFEINADELKSRLQGLNVPDKTIDNLLVHLKNERAIIGFERSQMIRDNVQKARTDAINRAVNTMKRVSKPKDAPKRSGFIKALTAAAEAGVLDSNAVRDAFAEAYDLHGLTQARMEALADILRRIEAMPEGIPKETLLELAHSALNDIAPSSSVINWLYQNLLGGVLSGASTIVSQFSQLSAVLNPFQATYQFMTKAAGRPMRNPATFARVWRDYLVEAWRTKGTVLEGMRGIAGGQVAGLGVSPSPMASFRPQQQQLSRFGPLETWKFRVGRADWVKALMGTEPKTTAGRFIKGSLLFPSWMASRSFNMIRGAEAWTGSIDRNMEARAALMGTFVKNGMSPNAAYNKMSDRYNPRTNKVMWDEALAGADKDISEGLTVKGLRRQRAEEIMQDMLDKEFNVNLKNRHRMMSAHRNFKDDPLTRPGQWFAKDMMGKAPTLVKCVFLFSRFFANAMERAIMNSPLGYIHMSKATAAKGAQTELHKRIEAMFGSLENYRQYRNGLATSSVVSTFVMTTALALAWAFWKWGDDDDEGKPPVFWITGATPPSSPYATSRQLAAAGWWQPNTLVLNLPGMEKPLLLNYVQGNPELAITLAAVGNVADRIMFPEMLNYKVDPRTGEREFSPFKSIIQPFTNALVSPATRSTYVTTQQAIQRALEGDPKGLAKLLSRPAGEVAAATVLGGPGVRDIRKAAMPDTPRASQSWKQALASGVPFADAIGMDTGAPMMNQFGEGVTPFSHIPFITAAQESSDSVKSAAKILNDIGITKQGPEEWMTAPDVYEIALNGDRVALSTAERGEVLGDVGMRFAREVNANERKIRSAKDYDDKKKVVQDLMKDARAQVLRQWRHRVKREE